MHSLPSVSVPPGADYIQLERPDALAPRIRYGEKKEKEQLRQLRTCKIRSGEITCYGTRDWLRFAYQVPLIGSLRRRSFPDLWRDLESAQNPVPPSFPTHQPGTIEAVVGPVIGLVTQTSARILLEISADCAEGVGITLQAVGINFQDATNQIVLRMQRKRPRVFVFKNLVPGTYYKVRCSVVTPGLVNSGFWTLRQDWSLRRDDARIALVSGHVVKPKREPRSRAPVPEGEELWKNLYKLAVRGALNMIVHLDGAVSLSQKDGSTSQDGNVSSAMERAQNLISQKRTMFEDGFNDMRDDIREIFRDAYRNAWTSSLFVRHVLANCSNLMMPSSEAVGVDLTAYGHWVPGNADRTLALECAFDVYMEYQAPLYEAFGKPAQSAIEALLLPTMAEDDVSRDRKSQTSDRAYLGDTESGAEPSTLRPLHQLHVLGDVALCFVDITITPIFQLLLKPESMNEIEETFEAVLDSFTPRTGSLDQCRFVVIIIPQLFLDPFRDWPVSHFRKMQEEMSNNAWTLSRRMVTALLRSAVEWRGSKEFSRRSFCIVTDHACGATFEKLCLREAILDGALKTRRNDIYVIGVPPIDRKLEPIRGIPSACYHRRKGQYIKRELKKYVEEIRCHQKLSHNALECAAYMRCSVSSSVDAHLMSQGESVHTPNPIPATRPPRLFPKRAPLSCGLKRTVYSILFLLAASLVKEKTGVITSHFSSCDTCPHKHYCIHDLCLYASLLQKNGFSVLSVMGAYSEGLHPGDFRPQACMFRNQVFIADYALDHTAVIQWNAGLPLLADFKVAVVTERSKQCPGVDTTVWETEPRTLTPFSFKTDAPHGLSKNGICEQHCERGRTPHTRCYGCNLQCCRCHTAACCQLSEA